MMMPRMRMPMRGPHPPMGPQGPPLRPPMHGPPHGRMPPPRPVMPPGPVPQQQGPIVGSVTNDPATAASRVFVGNLNTIALSKEDVEGIFKRYGMVTGLSMHKGYAFIQYAKANDARRACMNEDGKTYANQTLDINIASEPKNRSGTQATVGSKRSVSQTNFTTYSSSTAKTSLTRSLSGGGPPAKKPRSDIQISGGMKRTLVSLTSGDTGTEAKPAVKKSTGKALSGKDVLICGVCKSSFASLHSLAQHKKTPCRLRFSCQCKDAPPPECPEPQVLFCASCDAQFSACWDLVVHAQQEHSVAIYKQEGDETTEVIEEVVVVKEDVNGE